MTDSLPGRPEQQERDKALARIDSYLRGGHVGGEGVDALLQGMACLLRAVPQAPSSEPTTTLSQKEGAWACACGVGGYGEFAFTAHITAVGHQLVPEAGQQEPERARVLTSQAEVDEAARQLAAPAAAPSAPPGVAEYEALLRSATFGVPPNPRKKADPMNAHVPGLLGLFFAYERTADQDHCGGPNRATLVEALRQADTVSSPPPGKALAEPRKYAASPDWVPAPDTTRPTVRELADLMREWWVTPGLLHDHDSLGCDECRMGLAAHLLRNSFVVPAPDSKERT